MGLSWKSQHNVGCKIKMKVHLFNRDTQEKDTTSKSYWTFELISLNIKNSGKGFTWNLRPLCFVSHNEQKMSYFAH